MRLIDADKLNNIRFMGYRDEDGNLLVPLRDVTKAIRLAPTVDAVEVVRCKDCLWAEKLTERDKELYNENCVMCPALNPFGNKVPMEREGFCHIGRRKDSTDDG